jgi:hypothetical protein
MKGVKGSIFLKSLSPKIAVKVIESFDRVTALVVGVCWAGAALMIGFALYTVNLTVTAKHAAETALVAEPVLPKAVHRKIEARDVQGLIDRLQHRYPDLIITFKNSLSISAADGSKFHDWLNVLSYMDEISPQNRWNMEEFCVGRCSGNVLMQATLTGEKITFEKPQLEEKK